MSTWTRQGPCRKFLHGGRFRRGLRHRAPNLRSRCNHMATIRKRTLPSGKAVWLAGYVDGGGKRLFRQFHTKREADGFLTEAKSQVAAGVHTPDSVSPTVAEAAQ